MAKNLLPLPNTALTDKNGASTLEFRKWLEAVGGLLTETNVIPLSSLPANVQNSSSNNALASGRLFMAADSDVVSFGGTYGSNPKRIEADTSLIPTPSAGYRINAYAENISPTGFTARVRLQQPTGTTTHNTGAGSFDALLGFWTAEKPVTNDAYNRIYNYKFTAVLSLISAFGGGGEPYEATYQGLFEVYAYISGVWTLITTIEINHVSTAFGFPAATYTYTDYIEAIEISQSIGMVAGAEFGIRPIVGNVTAFSNVDYQTQTYGSDTSYGSEKLKWWVYA